MKHRGLPITLIVVVLAALAPVAAAQTPSPTPQPQVEASVRYERINVRSGPGVRFTRLGQLRRHERVTVTGRSDEENNWLRIRFNESEGWIAYFTVRPGGVVSQLPVVAPANAQIAIREPETMTARVFRTVNVREEPAIDSEKIDQLFSGDKVAVLARNSTENGWLLIEHDGQEGWVAYFTVTLVGHVERLDVAEQDDEDPIPLTLEGEEPAVVAVAFRTVNVRAGPGMIFEQIDQMTSGDRAAVTGRSDESNNWLQIDYNGQTGWVAYFTVTVTGDLDSLPVVAPEF